MKKALALILVTLFATSVMFAQETTKEPKKAAKTSKTTKATKKPANTKEVKATAPQKESAKPMKK